MAMDSTDPQADISEGLEQARLQFIDLVAHELKQPMTAIQGYTTLLRLGMGGELNETQRQFVDVIHANVGRMGSLVNNLLEISRLEAGRIRLEFARVDLKTVVEEVVTAARSEIDARDHVLQIDLAEGLPQAWGDRQRLAQILTHLLSNACRYTPQGGTIRIAVDLCHAPQLPAGHLRVSVTDTGIGLTPEEIASLDKFFRADHDFVQQQAGSGLGVPIARGLVALHGGEFWVESEPQRGSTFSFTVPPAGGRPRGPG
jgi:signal transduction histidine kinase